jgi:hypothetical protein
MKIERPSKKEVQKYLKLWDSLENYVSQESSLRKLFTVTYPENNDLDDVLIKVCSLNDFYNTNIFSPFTVAKHIINLKIDKKLEESNLEIVNKIADISVNGGKRINFYSFATKYCSHHKPAVYPIYDSYVEKMLMFFKRNDEFAKFIKNDLREYKRYKEILLNFQSFYDLKDFGLKQIDKYLWQAGKKYFPKKY